MTELLVHKYFLGNASNFYVCFRPSLSENNLEYYANEKTILT